MADEQKSPPKGSSLSDEDLRTRQDECLLAIRRTMMTLLAFGLFVLLTIGKPDRQIFQEGLTVKVPFAETDVSFVAFLIVAPLVLVSVWVYLQVYIEELRHPEFSCIPPRIPAIAGSDRHVPKMLFFLISEVLVPAILVAVAFKASFLPNAPFWFAGVAVFASISAILSWRRLDRTLKPISRLAPIGIWLTVALCGIAFATWPNFSSQFVPLDLREANLENIDLRGARLVNADLTFAVFGKARLDNANLSHANLTQANLASVSLIKAELSDANLFRADLAKANLAEANLSRANFVAANLAGAIFTGANLTDTNLTNANLTDAILWSTKLQDANFSGAWLVGADFTSANVPGTTFDGANLSDTIFFGVNFGTVSLRGGVLSRADLRTAINLTPEQLASACTDPAAPPNLPPALDTPPPCPPSKFGPDGWLPGFIPFEGKSLR